MSFFDNLFGNGGSSANKYAKAAANELQAAGQGAIGFEQPYYITGNAGNANLANLAGVAGQGAQNKAFAAWQNSPYAKALGLSGGYQRSPGYAFQMQQGLNAVNAGAANRGALNSGANEKALEEYGQGLANQDYGNWEQKLQNAYGNYTQGLAGLANTGANAAGQMGDQLLRANGAAAGQIAQIGANKTAGANGVAGLALGGLGKLAGAIPWGSSTPTYGTSGLY